MASLVNAGKRFTDGLGDPHAHDVLVAGEPPACLLSQSMLSTLLQSKRPAHPPAAHMVPLLVQSYVEPRLHGTLPSCRSNEIMHGSGDGGGGLVAAVRHRPPPVTSLPRPESEPACKPNGV